jgi:cytochrome c peroxidase
MTDDSFHDAGLATTDPGRSAVPGGMAGIAAFKTPGLRQVANTAPYMHDGSLATLESVVDHYAGKIVQRPSLSPNIVRDLELDAAERAALVAFLKTL